MKSKNWRKDLYLKNRMDSLETLNHKTVKKLKLNEKLSKDWNKNLVFKNNKLSLNNFIVYTALAFLNPPFVSPPSDPREVYFFGLCWNWYWHQL